MTLSAECESNASGECDGGNCECPCHDLPASVAATWTTEDYRDWHAE